MTPQQARAEYDAGSRNIPGGLISPVERVVVVGGGIAGLTVAAAMVNAGVECVVLEARDRIGGRLHTIDLAGTPIDMGGSWIHHPIGNPLSIFADAKGVARAAGDPMPRIAAYDRTEARRLTQAELDHLMQLEFELFDEGLDKLRDQLPDDASAADAIATFVASTDLDPATARRVRQALRASIEADAADTAERQSLTWMWNEIEYEGDLFGDLPVDGYKAVVDAMAVGVDVRLGFEVESVSQVDGGVSVRGVDGSVEEGSHVVVAVPLGVLKRGVPQFVPALPDARVGAIERLGFGPYEKVVLRFDEPFWRDAGMSHLIVLPREEDEPALWLFDLDDFGAGPALSGHVFASAVHHVHDASPEAAVQWLMEMVSEVLGSPCPEPIAYAVTSWAADPFTAGAYTHVPPGASPDDVDTLGEPVGGRILFAGEHTQSARTGYADGAMSSGVREAKRLLGTASVTLGGSS